MHCEFAVLPILIFLYCDVITIGVGSGGSGGHWPPLLVKFRAIFEFSGNLSKCLYILPEKFVTAITPPKKKRSSLVWPHVW